MTQERFTLQEAHDSGRKPDRVVVGFNHPRAINEVVLLGQWRFRIAEEISRDCATALMKAAKGVAQGRVPMSSPSKADLTRATNANSVPDLPYYYLAVQL